MFGFPKQSLAALLLPQLSKGNIIQVSLHLLLLQEQCSGAVLVARGANSVGVGDNSGTPPNWHPGLVPLSLTFCYTTA